MSFVGAGRDNTRLLFSGTGNYLITLSDGSLVEGFHLDGVVVDTVPVDELRYALPRAILGESDVGAIVRDNRIVNVEWAIYLVSTDEVDTTKRVSIVANEFSHFHEAVYLFGASSDIRNNVFYVNNSSIGSPIDQALKSARITGNEFYRTVRSAGQLIDLYKPSIIDVRNNILISPPSAHAGGIWINNQAHGFPTTGRIENNLCVGADRGISSFGGDIRITNNMVIGTILDLQYDSVATTPGSVGFNLFWQNELWVDTAARISSGCILACPMFQDTNDYLLQAFSPAIDAGDTLLKDLDGSRSDIGPCGGVLGISYSYLDLPPGVPGNSKATGSDTGIFLQWSGHCEADFERYELYRDSLPFTNPLPSLLLSSTSADTQYFDSSIAPGRSYYYRLRSLDSQGNASDLSEALFASATGVFDDAVLPDEFVLYPNVPNPFNGSTVIRFSIAAGQRSNPVRTQLTILDLLGRNVITLVSGTLPPGEYRALWCGVDSDGGPVASGPYMIRLQVDGMQVTRKALLLK